LEDQCVITREITVAGGLFAPGHLGELTQIVPFEMVDQALAATGTTQARLRVLPARVTGSAPCERDVRGRLFAFYDYAPVCEPGFTCPARQGR
jgi:Insertion element 4 transposase N-terminal